ncbi:hypothetical protein [Amycolatopsis sp. NPDC059657]|uniref:hypothetical protein n=1 Tax=Amycolatopsis sp. NPDC059657 TaxID=3346899 RepID=UPI00366B992D
MAFGRSLRREHLVAASLAGAVVVVVGYASGLGLKPGTVAAAEPPPVAQGTKPAPEVQPSQGNPPPPELPQPVAPPPLPPVPVIAPPSHEVPPDPGPVVVEPTPPSPPSTPPPPPPPPGSPLPECQPSVLQPVGDTVAALPLLGDLTKTLGVTGPDGLLTAVIGYCAAKDGTVQAISTGSPVG